MEVTNGSLSQLDVKVPTGKLNLLNNSSEDYLARNIPKHGGIERRILIFYILQSTEYLIFSFPNILTILAVFKFEVLHSKPTNLLIGSLSFADSLLFLNCGTSLVALFWKNNGGYKLHTLFYNFKKRKLDSLIFPGAQGQGPVTRGHVEYPGLNMHRGLKNHF